MKRFLANLVGLAAIVGFRSMFGMDEIEHEIEIDPITGRETLYSLIGRRQRELKSQRR